MIKKTRLIVTIYLFAAFLITGGCVPALVVGGAAGVGKMIYQDKTVGESISDQTVWAKIRAAFVRADIDSLVGSVNVKVNEGRVLLTGTVAEREDMVKIVKICWQQDGVREVINELKVKNKDDGGFMQYARDSWITTNLKSKLFFAKNIKSVNYNVITINGVVYIIGIAQSQESVSKVTDIASQISGVKEVISYIRVKKDADEATGEVGSSDNSVEEFEKEEKDVKEVDVKEEVVKENGTKEVEISKKEVAKTTKQTAKKNKSSDKQSTDDIFSEEDFESF